MRYDDIDEVEAEFPFPPQFDPNDSLLFTVTPPTSSCSVVFTEDLYIPRAFRASQRLERTNQKAIRSSRSSHDMITLFEGSDQEQARYLWGMVCTSVVVLILFLFQTCIILAFRESGHERMGFLAGRFVRPKPPRNRQEPHQQTSSTASSSKQEGTESDSIREEKKDEVIEWTDQKAGIKLTGSSNEDQKEGETNPLDEKSETQQLAESLSNNDGEEKEEPGIVARDEPANSECASLSYEEKYSHWESICDQQTRRLHRTRIALAVCFLGIIAFCIVFCYNGNKYVNNAMKDVRNGLLEVQDRCVQAITLIVVFLERQAIVPNITLEAFQNGTVCPGLGDLNETSCDILGLDTLPNCTAGWFGCGHFDRGASAKRILSIHFEFSGRYTGYLR